MLKTKNPFTDRLDADCDPVLCDWGSGGGAFRLLHFRWWRKKQGKSDAVLSFVSFQSLKRHTCSVVKLRRKAPSGEKQQQGAHQKAKQSKEEQRKEKKRKYDSYNQPTCRLRSREARGTEIGQRFLFF